MARHELGAGNDTFAAGQNTAGADAVYGGGGNDIIAGGEGDDTLWGDEGDDQLDGGAGADGLNGGEGRDQLNGGAGDDTLQGFTGDDTVDGGDGRDTLYLTGDATEYDLSMTADGFVRILHKTPEYVNAGTETVIGAVDLVRNVEVLRFYSSNDPFDLEGWIAANSTPAGFNAVRGTAGADTLSGGAGRDAIYGGEGNDSLSGLAGDDLLVGGAGADALNGGDGVDTVSYRGGGSSVRIGSRGYQQPTDDAEGDTYIGIERIELTGLNDTVYWSGGAIEVQGFEGEDVLVGDGGADTLGGGAGNDTLNGAGGNDRLEGGAGVDRLEGREGDDLLLGGADADILLGGEGYDTVSYADLTSRVVIGTTFSENADADYLSIEAFVLTNFDDFIRLPVSRGEEGNSPAAISDVFAGAGNDVVDGGPLAGRLFGEAGDDTITAGFYGSLIDGGDGNDTLVSSVGSDTVVGGAGTDTVVYGRSRGSYLIERDGDVIIVADLDNGFVDRLTGVETLSFPVEASDDRVLISASSIGASPAMTFSVGDATANRLDGGAGSDMMFGQAGADRLYAGAAHDVVSGGEGADELDGGMGIDTLYGGAGDDVLSGSYGNDELFGGDGADRLSGGVGDDRLDGGAGVDTAAYALAASGVTVSLAVATAQKTGGAGTDILAGIENLNGSRYADTLTGDAGANTLRGEGGADVLNGAAGHDVITGGTGDDVIDAGLGRDRLWGGAGADRFVFGRLQGADTIYDFGTGDQLALRATSFGLSAGTFDPALLQHGDAATGDKGVFLFNDAKRVLYWDPDGAGARAAEAVVAFTTPVTIDASDFLLM